MRRYSARALRLIPSRFALLLFAVFALLPFAWMLTASLEPPSALYRNSGSLIPHPFTMQNYLNVLQLNSANSNDFVQQFVNSVIVAGSTVVLALLVAVPAAYGFSRFHFPARRSILYAILVQSIFPLVNFLVPLYILMQDVKLVNTYGALIIGYLTFSLPLDIWLLKGFFDGIPADMEISARLDGASRWRAFVEVTLADPRDRDMAMVFQNYALYAAKTVRGNLEFPLRMRGVAAAERHQRASELAEILGLTAVMGHYPRQLSGGQQQRVALGRALIRCPKLFLMDEPLSNLDAPVRRAVAYACTSCTTAGSRSPGRPSRYSPVPVTPARSKLLESVPRPDAGWRAGHGALRPEGAAM